MQGLRGKLEIHVVDARPGFPVPLAHFDRVIGAAKLAHHAAYAELGPFGDDLPGLEDKYLLWAKGHADTAALAITLAYGMDIRLVR
jgi:hypothetical protein